MERRGGNPAFCSSVPRRARPTRTPHAALSSALLLAAAPSHWTTEIFSFTFLSLFPAHARTLIDAMGDAAAAAASTSAPDTPTYILICREDGSDLLADADDGTDADIVVARDERLLVVDPDEEYVALLLSEESASGSGAPAEEMEEWMKAARSGCVSWIIKVVRAGALPPSSSPRFGFCQCSSLVLLLADHGDVPVRREDRLRRGHLPRSLPDATASQCNYRSMTLHFPLPSPCTD